MQLSFKGLTKTVLDTSGERRGIASNLGNLDQRGTSLIDPRYNVDIQTHRNPSSRILAESEKTKIAAIEAAICPLVKFVNAKRALESGISNRKNYPESRVLPALFAA